MISNTNKSPSHSHIILGDYDNKSAIKVRYIINYTLLNISIRKYV